MVVSELNSRALTPSFNAAEQLVPPVPTRLGFRKMYYYLVNVEEHPEVLPLAYDVAVQRLARLQMAAWDAFVRPVGGAADALASVIERIAKQRDRFLIPWQLATEDLKRRQVLHYFTQYMPTALVDGCWLQSSPRVSTAHTKV